MKATLVTQLAHTAYTRKEQCETESKNASISLWKDHMELLKVQGNDINAYINISILHPSKIHNIECYIYNGGFSLEEDIRDVTNCKIPLKDKIEKRIKFLGGQMTHFCYL